MHFDADSSPFLVFQFLYSYSLTCLAKGFLGHTIGSTFHTMELV